MMELGSSKSSSSSSKQQEQQEQKTSQQEAAFTKIMNNSGNSRSNMTLPTTKGFSDSENESGGREMTLPMMKRQYYDSDEEDQSFEVKLPLSDEGCDDQGNNNNSRRGQGARRLSRRKLIRNRGSVENQGGDGGGGSDDATEGTISMGSVAGYLLDNMPEELRNKISQEAWEKMFERKGRSNSLRKAAAAATAPGPGAGGGGGGAAAPASKRSSVRRRNSDESIESLASATSSESPDDSASTVSALTMGTMGTLHNSVGSISTNDDLLRGAEGGGADVLSLGSDVESSTEEEEDDDDDDASLTKREGDKLKPEPRQANTSRSDLFYAALSSSSNKISSAAEAKANPDGAEQGQHNNTKGPSLDTFLSSNAATNANTSNEGQCDDYLGHLDDDDDEDDDYEYIEDYGDNISVISGITEFTSAGWGQEDDISPEMEDGGVAGQESSSNRGSLVPSETSWDTYGRKFDNIESNPRIRKVGEQQQQQQQKNPQSCHIVTGELQMASSLNSYFSEYKRSVASSEEAVSEYSIRLKEAEEIVGFTSKDSSSDPELAASRGASTPILLPKKIMVGPQLGNSGTPFLSPMGESLSSPSKMAVEVPSTPQTPVTPMAATGRQISSQQGLLLCEASPLTPSTLDTKERENEERGGELSTPSATKYPFALTPPSPLSPSTLDTKEREQEEAGRWTFQVQYTNEETEDEAIDYWSAGPTYTTELRESPQPSLSRSGQIRDYDEENVEKGHGLNHLVLPPEALASGGSFHSITESLDSHHSIEEEVQTVRFGNVRIRHHERILDINPSVSVGAAVGIGWSYCETQSSIEEYESERASSRRSGKDLVLSRQDRDSLLSEWGFQKKEIAAAVRNILKAKHRRRVSVQNLHVQKLEEAVEKSTRKIKKIFRRRKKKPTEGGNDMDRSGRYGWMSGSDRSEIDRSDRSGASNNSDASIRSILKKSDRSGTSNSSGESKRSILNFRGAVMGLKKTSSLPSKLTDKGRRLSGDGSTANEPIPSHAAGREFNEGDADEENKNTNQRPSSQDSKLNSSMPSMHFQSSPNGIYQRRQQQQQRKNPDKVSAELDSIDDIREPQTISSAPALKRSWSKNISTTSLDVSDLEAMQDVPEGGVLLDTSTGSNSNNFTDYDEQMVRSGQNTTSLETTKFSPVHISHRGVDLPCHKKEKFNVFDASERTILPSLSHQATKPGKKAQQLRTSVEFSKRMVHSDQDAKMKLMDASERTLLPSLTPRAKGMQGKPHSKMDFLERSKKSFQKSFQDSERTVPSANLRLGGKMMEISERTIPASNKTHSTNVSSGPSDRILQENFQESPLIPEVIDSSTEDDKSSSLSSVHDNPSKGRYYTKTIPDSNVLVRSPVSARSSIISVPSEGPSIISRPSTISTLSSTIRKEDDDLVEEPTELIPHTKHEDRGEEDVESYSIDLDQPVDGSKPQHDKKEPLLVSISKIEDFDPKPSIFATERLSNSMPFYDDDLPIMGDDDHDDDDDDDGFVFDDLSVVSDITEYTMHSVRRRSSKKSLKEKVKQFYLRESKHSDDQPHVPPFPDVPDANGSTEENAERVREGARESTTYDPVRPIEESVADDELAVAETETGHKLPSSQPEQVEEGEVAVAIDPSLLVREECDVKDEENVFKTDLNGVDETEREDHGVGGETVDLADTGDDKRNQGEIEDALKDETAVDTSKIISLGQTSNPKAQSSPKDERRPGKSLFPGPLKDGYGSRIGSAGDNFGRTKKRLPGPLPSSSRSSSCPLSKEDFKHMIDDYDDDQFSQVTDYSRAAMSKKKRPASRSSVRRNKRVSRVVAPDVDDDGQYSEEFDASSFEVRLSGDDVVEHREKASEEFDASSFEVRLSGDHDYFMEDREKAGGGPKGLGSEGSKIVSGQSSDTKIEISQADFENMMNDCDDDNQFSQVTDFSRAAMAKSREQPSSSDPKPDISSQSKVASMIKAESNSPSEEEFNQLMGMFSSDDTSVVSDYSMQAFTKRSSGKTTRRKVSRVTRSAPYSESGNDDDNDDGNESYSVALQSVPSTSGGGPQVEKRRAVISDVDGDESTVGTAEVMDFVLNTMPEKARKGVSKDTWERIFKNEFATEAKPPAFPDPGTAQAELELAEEDFNQLLQSYAADDASAVSDYSMQAFAKRNTGKKSSRRKISRVLKRQPDPETNNGCNDEESVESYSVALQSENPSNYGVHIDTSGAKKRRAVPYPMNSDSDASTVATAEVMDFVLNNMPEKARKGVSKDTWERIFKNESAADAIPPFSFDPVTSSSGVDRADSELAEEEFKRMLQSHDAADDASAVSDYSMQAFAKRTTGKRNSQRKISKVVRRLPDSETNTGCGDGESVGGGSVESYSVALQSENRSGCDITDNDAGAKKRRAVPYPMASDSDVSSVATVEVMDFVLNTMPEKARKGVSNDTWKRIFRDEPLEQTPLPSEPKIGSQFQEQSGIQTEPDFSEEDFNQLLQSHASDDASAVSDYSMQAFAKRASGKKKKKKSTLRKVSRVVNRLPDAGRSNDEDHDEESVESFSVALHSESSHSVQVQDADAKKRRAAFRFRMLMQKSAEQNQMTSESDASSVDTNEVMDFVLNSMPETTKKGISKDTWERIFKTGAIPAALHPRSSGAENGPQSNQYTESKELSEEDFGQLIQSYNSDDASAVSDYSMQAFAKKRSGKRSSRRKVSRVVNRLPGASNDFLDEESVGSYSVALQSENPSTVEIQDENARNKRRATPYPMVADFDASSVATAEVMDFVLNSMPEKSKKGISKDTWARMFRQEDLPSPSTEPGVGLDSTHPNDIQPGADLPPEERLNQLMQTFDSDDASAVSDYSMQAFAKRSSGKTKPRRKVSRVLNRLPDAQTSYPDDKEEDNGSYSVALQSVHSNDIVKGGKRRTAVSDGDRDGDESSVGTAEVMDFVVNIMPETAKKGISKETWERIFNNNGSTTKTVPRSSSEPDLVVQSKERGCVQAEPKLPLSEESLKQVMQAYDFDDASAVSDYSMQAFAKRNTGKKKKSTPRTVSRVVSRLPDSNDNESVDSFSVALHSINSEEFQDGGPRKRRAEPYPMTSEEDVSVSTAEVIGFAWNTMPEKAKKGIADETLRKLLETGSENNNRRVSDDADDCSAKSPYQAMDQTSNTGNNELVHESLMQIMSDINESNRSNVSELGSSGRSTHIPLPSSNAASKGTAAIDISRRSNESGSSSSCRNTPLSANQQPGVGLQEEFNLILSDVRKSETELLGTSTRSEISELGVSGRSAHPHLTTATSRMDSSNQTPPDNVLKQSDEVVDSQNSSSLVHASSDAINNDVHDGSLEEVGKGKMIKQAPAAAQANLQDGSPGQEPSTELSYSESVIARMMSNLYGEDDDCSVFTDYSKNAFVKHKDSPPKRTQRSRKVSRIVSDVPGGQMKAKEEQMDNTSEKFDINSYEMPIQGGQDRGEKHTRLEPVSRRRSSYPTFGRASNKEVVDNLPEPSSSALTSQHHVAQEEESSSKGLSPADVEKLMNDLYDEEASVLTDYSHHAMSKRKKTPSSRRSGARRVSRVAVFDGDATPADDGMDNSSEEFDASSFSVPLPPVVDQPHRGYASHAKSDDVAPDEPEDVRSVATAEVEDYVQQNVKQKISEATWSRMFQHQLSQVQGVATETESSQPSGNSKVESSGLSAKDFEQYMRDMEDDQCSVVTDYSHAVARRKNAPASSRKSGARRVSRVVSTPPDGGDESEEFDTASFSVPVPDVDNDKPSHRTFRGTSSDEIDDLRSVATAEVEVYVQQNVKQKISEATWNRMFQQASNPAEAAAKTTSSQSGSDHLQQEPSGLSVEDFEQYMQDMEDDQCSVVTDYSHAVARRKNAPTSSRKSGARRVSRVANTQPDGDGDDESEDFDAASFSVPLPDVDNTCNKPSRRTYNGTSSEEVDDDMRSVATAEVEDYVLQNVKQKISEATWNRMFEQQASNMEDVAVAAKTAPFGQPGSDHLQQEPSGLSAEDFKQYLQDIEDDQCSVVTDYSHAVARRKNAPSSTRKSRARRVPRVASASKDGDEDGNDESGDFDTSSFSVPLLDLDNSDDKPSHRSFSDGVDDVRSVATAEVEDYVLQNVKQKISEATWNRMFQQEASNEEEAAAKTTSAQSSKETEGDSSGLSPEDFELYMLNMEDDQCSIVTDYSHAVARRKESSARKSNRRVSRKVVSGVPSDGSVRTGGDDDGTRGRSEDFDASSFSIPLPPVNDGVEAGKGLSPRTSFGVSSYQDEDLQSVATADVEEYVLNKRNVKQQISGETWTRMFQQKVEHAREIAASKTTSSQKQVDSNEKEISPTDVEKLMKDLYQDEEASVVTDYSRQAMSKSKRAPTRRSTARRVSRMVATGGPSDGSSHEVEDSGMDETSGEFDASSYSVPVPTVDGDDKRPYPTLSAESDDVRSVATAEVEDYVVNRLNAKQKISEATWSRIFQQQASGATGEASAQTSSLHFATNSKESISKVLSPEDLEHYMKELVEDDQCSVVTDYSRAACNRKSSSSSHKSNARRVTRVAVSGVPSDGSAHEAVLDSSLGGSHDFDASSFSIPLHPFVDDNDKPVHRDTSAETDDVRSVATAEVEDYVLNNMNVKRQISEATWSRMFQQQAFQAEADLAEMTPSNEMKKEEPNAMELSPENFEQYMKDLVEDDQCSVVTDYSRAACKRKSSSRSSSRKSNPRRVSRTIAASDDSLHGSVYDGMDEASEEFDAASYSIQIQSVGDCDDKLLSGHPPSSDADDLRSVATAEVEVFITNKMQNVQQKISEATWSRMFQQQASQTGADAFKTTSNQPRIFGSNVLSPEDLEQYMNELVEDDQCSVVTDYSRAACKRKSSSSSSRKSNARRVSQVVVSDNLPDGSLGSGDDPVDPSDEEFDVASFTVMLAGDVEVRSGQQSFKRRSPDPADEVENDASTIATADVLDRIPQNVRNKISDETFRRMYMVGGVEASQQKPSNYQNPNLAQQKDAPKVVSKEDLEYLISNMDDDASVLTDYSRQIMSNSPPKTTFNHRRFSESDVEDARSAPPRRARDDRRSVSFSFVEVRSYERILDVNPGVSCGAAIGIGWRFDSEERFSIKSAGSYSYESSTRTARELRVPRHERETLLKQWGFTNKEITDATRSIWRAKHNRKVTVQNLRVERIEEAMENTARKIKNGFRRLGGGGGKKNNEDYSDAKESTDDDSEPPSPKRPALVSQRKASSRRRFALNSHAIDVPKHTTSRRLSMSSSNPIDEQNLKQPSPRQASRRRFSMGSNINDISPKTKRASRRRLSLLTSSTPDVPISPKKKSASRRRFSLLASSNSNSNVEVDDSQTTERAAHPRPSLLAVQSNSDPNVAAAMTHTVSRRRFSLLTGSRSNSNPSVGSRKKKAASRRRLSLLTSSNPDRDVNDQPKKKAASRRRLSLLTG